MKGDLCGAKEVLLPPQHSRDNKRERSLRPACLLREHLKTVLLLTARLLLPAPLDSSARGKNGALNHLSIKDHRLKELLQSTCFNQTSPLPESLTLSPPIAPSSAPSPPSSLQGEICNSNTPQESPSETTDGREDTHEKRRRRGRKSQSEDRLLQQERHAETSSDTDAHGGCPPHSPRGLEEKKEKLNEGIERKKARDLLDLGEEEERTGEFFSENASIIPPPLRSSSSGEEEREREKDVKGKEVLLENHQDITRDSWASISPEKHMKEKNQERNGNSADEEEEEDQDALLSCLFDILQKAEKLCCQLKPEKRSSSFFSSPQQREGEDEREAEQDTSYLPHPTNSLTTLTFLPCASFLPPSTEDRNEGSSPIKAASLPSSTPPPLFADLLVENNKRVLPVSRSRGGSRVYKTRRLSSSSSPPSERQGRWRGEEEAASSFHQLQARKRLSEYERRGDRASLMASLNCEKRRSSSEVLNSAGIEPPMYVYADSSRMIVKQGIERVEEAGEEQRSEGGEEDREINSSAGFLSQTCRENQLLSSKNRLPTIHRRYSAPVNRTEECSSSSPAFSFPRLRDFHLHAQTHASGNYAFPEFQLKRVEFLRRKLQQLAETVAREEEEKEKKKGEQEEKNKQGMVGMGEGWGRMSKFDGRKEEEEEQEEEGQEPLVRERGMNDGWMAREHPQPTLLTSPSPPGLLPRDEMVSYGFTGTR